MSEDEKSISPASKQRRSPSFPVIPIDEALDRIRQVYDKDGQASTTFEAVLEHMNYAAKNKGGRAGRVVSALKQYGLLDERGGQYRVSDKAFHILEMPDELPEKARMIKEAALSPPMFRKILKQNNGNLPSDTTLRYYLLSKERFNKDSAEDFIRVLRRTKELVNPLPEDYTDGEESEGGELSPEGGKLLSSLPPTPPQQKGLSGLPPERTAPRRDFIDPPPPGYWRTPAGWKGGQKELRFNIARDSEASVTFSGPVTQEAIGKLIVLLQASQDTFPTKVELEEQKPEPAEPLPPDASSNLGDVFRDEE